MRLFDSHCHLQDNRLFSDVDRIIERAASAGVRYMVCCGSTEGDWDDVLALARRYGSVIPALGIHPWYAAERGADWYSRLEAALLHDERITVGEIGLDHVLPVRNDDDQMELFHRQLALARNLGRPASIHCRKAWGTLMELLRREPGIAKGCVIHSYSGPAELVEELQHHGLALSFSGSVTYSRNKRAREAVVKVSKEFLLFETDSPDIPPVDYAGNNEPGTIVEVARAVAQLRGIDAEIAAEDAFAAACRIFRAVQDA